jgi:hypothetical protein
MSRVLVCTWGGSEDALAGRRGDADDRTQARGRVGVELALLVPGRHCPTPRRSRAGTTALDRVTDAKLGGNPTRSSRRSRAVLRRG